MAVIEAERADTANVVGAGPPRALRRRRRRMVGTLAVAAVFVVGAVGWRALTADGLTPDAFQPYGGVGMGTTRTIRPGTGYAIGMVEEIRPPDADIERVEARVTPGSAPVATSAVLCVPNPKDPTGIGAVSLAELSDYCSQILPAAGHNLADLPRGTSLVLAVTMLAPGPVTIRGIEVTYRQGIRRGHEVTGIGFRYQPPTRHR